MLSRPLPSPQTCAADKPEDPGSTRERSRSGEATCVLRLTPPRSKQAPAPDLAREKTGVARAESPWCERARPPKGARSAPGSSFSVSRKSPRAHLTPEVT